MGGFWERRRQSSLGRFYAKWNADLALNGAILIAWQTQFSLFPLLLGLLGIFGLVLRDPAQRQDLVVAVMAQFPAQVSDLLGFMEETRQLGGLLGLASMVGLIWSGYWLFGTMALVFNHFYDAPDRDLLGQVRMALTMMALYVVLITVSVLASGLSTFLTVVSERALPIDVPAIAVVLGWPVSLWSAIVMFLALYQVVPNRSLGLAQVWRGAVLAGVLFVLLSQVFPVYLRFFGGSYTAYKSLGLFLLLITWVYCLALVTVLGAEVNAFLEGYGACPDPDDPAPPPAAPGSSATPSPRFSPPPRR